MGNRLIFLYHCIVVISDGVTQEGRSATCWNRWFKLVGRRCRQIRISVNAEKRVGEG